LHGLRNDPRAAVNYDAHPRAPQDTTRKCWSPPSPNSSFQMSISNTSLLARVSLITKTLLTFQLYCTLQFYKFNMIAHAPTGGYSVSQCPTGGHVSFSRSGAYARRARRIRLVLLLDGRSIHAAPSPIPMTNLASSKLTM
jgi:hypothetical protein